MTPQSVYLVSRVLNLRFWDKHLDQHLLPVQQSVLWITNTLKVLNNCGESFFSFVHNQWSISRPHVHITFGDTITVITLTDTYMHVSSQSSLFSLSISSFFVCVYSCPMFTSVCVVFGKHGWTCIKKLVLCIALMHDMRLCWRLS